MARFFRGAKGDYAGRVGRVICILYRLSHELLMWHCDLSLVIFE